MTTNEKYSVLVICTGNSCRSQMAEGLTRHYLGDRVRVESAGVMPSYLNPDAIDVMKEIGIDISGHEATNVRHFEGDEFDLAITLCGNARDVCGIFPGANEQFHMGFDDPYGAVGSSGEVLDEFRRVRDELKEQLIPFIEKRLDRR